MSAPTEPIRVLIADDHPLFRAGMIALLTSLPDFTVTGEAATAGEAIALATRDAPDIVLMDVQMPGESGIDATRRILQTSPATRVLVVTMFEDDDLVFAALRAGARGYLLKGASPDETLRAIRVVSDGEAIFSPAIAQRLIDFFARPRPAPAIPFPDLTERGREVLTLIARKHTNPDIARRLGISLKTVRNHVSNIFSKLQVTDRADAIMRARDAGLDRDLP